MHAARTVKNLLTILHYTILYFIKTDMFHNKTVGNQNPVCHNRRNKAFMLAFIAFK